MVAAAVLGATALVAPASASSGAARVEVDQAWPVPRSAWVTVRGRGYGHGHGMSQYGAEGAARQGLTYRQILGFYYPGTTWGTARGPISVLVSADTTDPVEVLNRSGLTVRVVGGASVALPDVGARRWRLSAVSGGRTEVAYLADRWTRWRVLPDPAEFAAGGQPVSLVTPSGVRRYRGALRSAEPSADSAARDTVNVLSLEGYLRGVVPLEMPASWSPAAVRSQAVAARSYAAYERAHPRAAHYQVCDTTSCQVYGGVDAEHPAATAAVVATAGEALTDAQGPAFTQFSSSSGGWTAAGVRPYLPAQPDPYDGWSGNPVHTWSVRVTDRVVERAFPGIGNLTRIRVLARDGNGQWRGRVESMRLVGARGRVTISGATFRSALGLRSTWFSFAVSRR